MATKAHRGKTLHKEPSRGRGTCPVCKATRIKVLYDLVIEDDKTIKVCKRCQHKKPSEIDMESIKQLLDKSEDKESEKEESK